MGQEKYGIGVIGLGKFGFAFGAALAEFHADVMGLDRGADNVDRAKGVLAQVYQGDAMDRKVLEQLGFGDMRHVVVSVGRSIEASTMIVMYLKELGTQSVWVKAISRDHEKLLLKVGADEVVFPEDFAARQLAHKMAVPGLVAYLPVGRDIAVREFVVKGWAGKNLVELDLTNSQKVQVIAIRRKGESEYLFIPDARAPLATGDVLVLIGRSQDMDSLKG
ncbi:MAG: potassium channel family protein [Desulfovibrio sp.]|uniref:potassium channel family protein n=1 Tax=Desulfovibrio sp. 7SRBS1 TaxID=3378064 RepID=UPI003B413959